MVGDGIAGDGRGAPPVEAATGGLTPEQMVTIRRMQMVQESCVSKAGFHGLAGGFLGVFFGLVFGGYSEAVDRAIETKGPMNTKLRVGFRAAGHAMAGYAKTFAMWGAVYSITECSIEKYRAKHDLWNTLSAGCASGAILSSQPRVSIPAKSRIYQMGVGCGAMAAFSTAIDYFMEYR